MKRIEKEKRNKERGRGGKDVDLELRWLKKKETNFLKY